MHHITPALTLGDEPQGVSAARRWVRDACHDIGRDDLTECSVLAVSELVTNALLHARPPIVVRLRGTRLHPRVEVRDASDEPPVPSGSLEQDDDVHLVTFGRGLAIVGRCATTWGADLDDEGKVVWFHPAATPREEPADAVISGVFPSDPTDEVPPDHAHGVVAVELHGMPVRHALDFRTHFHEVHREVRLLALAHAADYPLAARLSACFGELGRRVGGRAQWRAVEAAGQAGQPTTDLRVAVPTEGAAAAGLFLYLLDLADAFCRAERLLAVPPSKEQRAFEEWFLGEFTRQQHGEPPVAWHDATVSTRRDVAS